VPITKNSNRKNKDGNDNHAGGFQLPVWRGRPARVTSAPSTFNLASTGHNIILRPAFLCDLCDLCGFSLETF
jgi:hypothetical protein